jgi:hypothetical protein
VTDENGSPGEPDEPIEIKTVNQIVAWNIAWYRSTAGLTQEELGKLVGRSKRNVSADERSWDGERTREFSAHEIVNYATAFGIPIIAFFLPPGDDGYPSHYMFRPHDGTGLLDMRSLAAAVLPDSDTMTIVMNAYRHRLLEVTGRYLHPSWSEQVARWLRNMTPPEVRAQQAEQLEADRDVLLGVAARLAEALEYARSEKPEEGQ